jgi:hypothetical protein
MNLRSWMAATKNCLNSNPGADVLLSNFNLFHNVKVSLNFLIWTACTDFKLV